MSLFRSLLVAAGMIVVGNAAAQPAAPPPPAAETSYAKAAATHVPLSQLPTGTIAPPPAPETSYNPAGTITDSKYALISTRRDDPEFPGFQLGLQAAAIAATGKPLAVAPLSEKDLLAQHQALIGRGAQVFLVDSPDPQKAAGFFQTGRFLEINAVLIAASQPNGFNPPIVLAPNHYTAERVGEEAIRRVGNTAVKVAYLPPTELPAGADAGALTEMFRKPFGLVAGKIELLELPKNPADAVAKDPAVVCALTPADGRRELTTLTKSFAKAKLVVPGESEAVRKAFADGLVAVRVHPDYARLFQSAVHEAEKRTDIPPVVPPVADVKE